MYSYSYHCHIQLTLSMQLTNQCRVDFVLLDSGLQSHSHSLRESYSPTAAKWYNSVKQYYWADTVWFNRILHKLASTSDSLWGYLKLRINCHIDLCGFTIKYHSTSWSDQTFSSPFKATDDRDGCFRLRFDSFADRVFDNWAPLSPWSLLQAWSRSFFWDAIVWAWGATRCALECVYWFPRWSIANSWVWLRG